MQFIAQQYKFKSKQKLLNYANYYIIYNEHFKSSSYATYSTDCSSYVHLRAAENRMDRHSFIHLHYVTYDGSLMRARVKSNC
jgi:hypothetical protein